MTEAQFYNLRFPIGIFEKPDLITNTMLNTWILTLENFPEQLVAITKDLNVEALNFKYRPDGWTIQQVVHHCADSHINSLLRFKIALTEDTPVIRPYLEDQFANLADYKQPIDTAILILKGVHAKLGILLKSLNPEDLKREFIHPEHHKHISIEEAIGIYAWHSLHHLAHIKQALEYKGSFN